MKKLLFTLLLLAGLSGDVFAQRISTTEIRGRGRASTPTCPQNYGVLWFDSVTKTWRKCEDGGASAALGGGTGTVTPSSTDTFTNKTLDAEGTGNLLTVPLLFEFIAAGANAGTGAPYLNLPITAAPSSSVTGTTVLNATLDFDAAVDESVQGHFWLPGDWTGSLDLNVEGLANEAGANVARLSIQTICIGAGETYDPAFNTAQTFAWTNTGANQRVVVTQTALTTTGCVAGERLYFKFLRDADATSGVDSLGVDFRLISLRFTVRRGI